MFFRVHVQHTHPDTGRVTDRLDRLYAKLSMAKHKARKEARTDPHVVAWVEIGQGWDTVAEIYYQSSRRPGRDLDISVYRKVEDGAYQVFHSALPERRPCTA